MRISTTTLIWTPSRRINPHKWINGISENKKLTVRISLQHSFFYVGNLLQEINSLKPTDNKKIHNIKYYAMFKIVGIILAVKNRLKSKGIMHIPHGSVLLFHVPISFKLYQDAGRHPSARSGPNLVESRNRGSRIKAYEFESLREEVIRG
jgi:hypothetical protein